MSMQNMLMGAGRSSGGSGNVGNSNVVAGSSGGTVGYDSSLGIGSCSPTTIGGYAVSKICTVSPGITLFITFAGAGGVGRDGLWKRVAITGAGIPGGSILINSTGFTFANVGGAGQWTIGGLTFPMVAGSSYLCEFYNP